MCGKCCQDLRVPLSLREAVAWIKRGHDVEVLCEAMPWPVEAEDGDAITLYKRDRSFLAACGALPVRIGVILVAPFSGPCPNRLSDMRCTIYDERPMVCRIYPAEFNPSLAFATERKKCPPEAWAASNPPLLRDGDYADDELLALIARFRATAVTDAGLKAGVCASLRIRSAALANEGYVVHRPDPSELLGALNAAVNDHREDAAAVPDGMWTLVSNRKATVETLEWMGAQAQTVRSGLIGDDGSGEREYLGFFSDEG